MNEMIVIEIYGVSKLGIMTILLLGLALIWALAKIELSWISEEEVSILPDLSALTGSGSEEPVSDKERLMNGVCPVCEGEIDPETVEKKDKGRYAWECETCDA